MRLGHDKVFETVGNTSLLQQVISRVSPICHEIIVVTAGERSFPRFTNCPNIRIVADTFPEKGPLGGIYTGLATSDSPVNLVVACDMPFLNQALLRYMIQLSPDFDLVIPQVNSYVEPLHAVYKKSCLAHIKNMIMQDKLRIYDFFDSVKVRYVGVEEIEKFDPRHLSLFNINTITDLELARELAKGDSEQ